MTTIDFNALMQEAGEGFQPIPPGPYTVEVEKAEPTTSSTNKPMIRATLRIIGGPHNGRKLFDQYTLSAGNPNALGFFFETMAALGLNRQFFAQNPPWESVAQMLLGRQCNVQVAIKQYQGTDRNEVKNYRPVAGGAPAMPGAPMMPGVPAMPGAAPVAAPGAPQPAQMPVPPPAVQQEAYPQQAPAAPQQVPQEWQQAAAAVQQALPEQQYTPPPVQMQSQPQPAPQSGQPPQAPTASEQPMWQPSAAPAGYDQQAPAQPQQPVPPPPGMVPPTPQVPQPPADPARSI